MDNVTRFGGIVPLWNNFKSLAFLGLIYYLGKIKYLLWQKTDAIGPIFIVVSGQINEK